MFKKILVPLDGSALSEEALPVVKELLEESAVEVTLFLVGEVPKATLQRRKGLRRPLPITSSPAGTYVGGVLPATPPAYAETKDQATERREHEILEYLGQAGRSLVETRCPIHAVVHFGEPAEEIIDLARRGRFDLIVMATHGRSGLRETLQGSVTTEVVRSGVAPVLVMRPKKRRRRRRS